jgi:hypothetical protein
MAGPHSAVRATLVYTRSAECTRSALMRRNPLVSAQYGRYRLKLTSLARASFRSRSFAGVLSSLQRAHPQIASQCLSIDMALSDRGSRLNH